MRSSRLSVQEDSTQEADAYAPVSLVEYGLQCIEQGHYAEGAAFLALARERLFPDHSPLTAALDALNIAIASHMQAQQALHEASKRFTASGSEQQTRIDALKKLLPALPDETLSVSSARTQPRKYIRGNQSLRLLPPLLSTTDRPAMYQVSSPEECSTLPALYFTCFGRFEVRRCDPSSHPLSLCNSLKGQVILRYLVAQPRRRETVEMLMAALWSEEDP